MSAPSRRTAMLLEVVVLLLLVLQPTRAAAALHVLSANNTWAPLGANKSAVGADCLYIGQGDGSTLSSCEESCVAVYACNLVNFDVTTKGCVFRACIDPAHPALIPAPGYSVYGLISRPPLPKGCYPRNSAPQVHHFGTADTPPLVADPPASWLPRIARHDLLYAPTDSKLDPRYMLPQIANGFLGTQIMTDSLFVTGIFNGYSSTAPSHLARLPAPLAVPAPGGNTTAVGWDVRQATYYRRASIDPAGPCTLLSNVTCTSAASTVWVEQRWYAHATLPSLMVMEVEVLASDTETAAWRARGSGGPPFAMLELINCPSTQSSDFALSSVPLSPAAPYTIQLGSTLVAETNTSALQTVAMLSSLWPAGGMLAVAAPGVATTYVTVVRTSIETPVNELASAVQEDWSAAMELASAGTLHALHVAELAVTMWAGGIEIDGREDIARVTNASLAGILGAMRVDRPFGISPGGMGYGSDSYLAYANHRFWDAEIWMGLGVGMFHPNVAASLTQYRFDRIDGARHKATTYSPPFKGAMFPWESASTGVEVCPTWASTGLREIHISGDIALQAWTVFRTQQTAVNTSWLARVAYPLLSGIADFWVSRTTPGADDGYLHINGVIPPDEYADNVTDSVYTNAVAKISLNAATAAAMLLGLPPSTYVAWLNTSALLPILFNETTGVHPEYAGFFNSTIKQADVILLGYPLQVTFGNMTPTSRRNDLLWYNKITDKNGPAMTYSMQAIGFIELGDADHAAQQLNASMKNALKSPFGVWSETPSGGCPNFLTGAGGYLQTMSAGFPQMRHNDTALVFTRPVLPSGSSRLTLRGLAYLGNRITVSYDATTVSFESVPVPDAATLDALPFSREYDAAASSAWRPPRRPDLSLLPSSSLSDRSSLGRVWLHGALLPSIALVVIDEGGRVYPLSSAQKISLPVNQVLTVTAANPGADLPMARVPFDVGAW